jgi:predicted dehydrogenase
MALLRVLVVGVGSIGERHLRCLFQTARATVALCEISDTLRPAIATRYGIEQAYATLERALEHRWDAAVVATPAHTHIGISRKLAERGVHLLIEKPLSVSIDGIRELAEDVRRQRLTAAVAYVHRAHPALAAMRGALLNGRFGKPLQIVSMSGHHFATARPAYPQTYFADRDKGGGAIQDALTHSINAGEWLVGPIDRVTADAAHQSLAGVNVEDTVHLAARHGPVMGAYVLNQYQMPEEFHITVTCEGGTTRYEPGHNRWRWMDTPGGAWHDEPSRPLERDDWFTLQANQFLDVVQGHADPLCTLEVGLQTLRVNLAALRSVERGGLPISIEGTAS